MKTINKFMMSMVMLLCVIFGISPHLTGQTGTQVFSTPGAHTLTVPPGVTQITVKIWGAGGGAGSGALATDSKGGGGGGGYVEFTQTVVPSASCPVIVGAGGAPGANGGSSSCSGGAALAAGGQSGSAPGGFGGGSYAGGLNSVPPVGGVLLSSLGNFGGNGGAATNPSPDPGGGGGGGAAGSAAGVGASGVDGGPSSNFALGGLGGAPGGGNGGNAGANGQSATAFGGGGGGKGSGATTSGSGADGRVEFTWTCPTLTSIAYGTAGAFCNSGSANPTIVPATATGGTFSSATLTGFLNASTGQIATGASAGTHTITYSWSAFGGCSAQSVTFTVQIGQSPSITTFTYATPFCTSNNTTVSPTLTANGATGTYSYTGTGTLGSFSSSTGSFNPSTSTAGSYIVTYSIPANNGCPALSQTANVVVTALPTISGFDYPGDNTYCAGEGMQTPSSTVSNPNGNTITYTSTAGLTLSATTGQINPATSTPGVYVVTMTIAAGAGCAAVMATSTVEILARPTAVINYSATNIFCQTVASTLQPVIITGVTGGPLTLVNWTTVAPALIINGSGAIDLNSPPGTYVVKYRFTGLNGCLDSASRTVTINARPTSTITYPAGTNPVCSNVSPVLSGVVTAVGPWTLTLSNGQFTTGSGNGPWSITINTLDPGETETYTVTSLVDANCSGVANPDMLGSITITKRTTTSGVIPNAAGIKVCENLDASVNVILTSPANNCAPNPQFTGVFQIEKHIGGGVWVPAGTYTWTLSPGPSTTGIAAAITIPASLLPNPTSSTILYRVSWISLVDCNGCTATPLTGTQVLEVSPVPILTISPAPVGDVCPGSNIVFDVFQAPSSTIVGAMFNWVATDAQGNVLGSADNVTFGLGAINTNLGLSCPYNNTITFTFTPVNPNCCTCLGIPVTRTVTVRDIVAPIWNVMNLDKTLECSDVAGIALAQGLKPVATDNCDNNVTNIVLTDSIVVANPACPQAKTITKKWTVTDDCGNTSVKFTQVITLQDTQAPVLTGTIPAGQTGMPICLSAAPDGPTAVAIALLYTDNCGTVTATKAKVTTGTDCGWTVTYTYTVKDNCGNTVAVSPVIVYTGADVTAPTIGTNTFPAGQTGMNICLSAAPAGATEAAIAGLYSDNCGGTITVVKTTTTTGTDCGWTVTYTYSIKDKCGNEVLPRPTQVYSGADAIAPTIGNNTFPVGGTGLNLCLSAAPAGATEAAIAALYSDNCGGTITVVKTTVTTGTDCGWTVTYTYSIKDKCGNEVSPKPTQVFSGADATAPTIGTNTFPVGGTGLNLCLINAPTGATEAAIAALYSDNCGGTITVVKTTVTTGTDCGWTVTYTYSIKDKCGNEVTSKPTQVFSGSDQTAPSIGTNTFPVGQTGINSCYSATLPVGPLEAAVAALYTDNCGGLITVVKTRVNNSTNNCNWSITYTYSIKDKCNNEVLPRPTVTYTGSDQTAPVFTSGIIPDQTLNTGIGVNCSAFMPSYIGLFTATDCSGVTYAQLAPNAIGTEVFGFNGFRWVVIEATDACGNKTKDSVKVFLKDLTPPNAICKPFTLVLNANGTGTIVLANVNNGSFDNCTPTPQLVYGLSQTSFNCTNVGTNNVVLTVTDLCGNVGTCTAVVTVVDNTPPVITCWGDTTINKDANCTYTMPDLRFRANRTDACGIANVTQNPAVGSIFGASIQNVTVTLTATDVNGNSSNCTFKINFVDVTPPVISGCPSNITVNTGLGNTTCSQTATWTPPTATDACLHLATQTQPITSNFNPGATFPVGVTTVTYTATDLSGNTSTCSFTVTVVDNTKPIIANCPANVSVNTAANATTCAATASWTAPTFTDNCSSGPLSGLAFTTSPNAGLTNGGQFPVGTTTVTYIATDASGNTSIPCVFTVIVKDVTKPIITCPGNIVTVPNVTGCLASINNPAPTYSDACGVASVSWTMTGVGTSPAGTASPLTGFNFIGIKSFNVGVTTITYLATDVNGNTQTCSYTVTVNKPLLGVISGTSTVLQNIATTSTVGFTSSGGVAPYTIVYTTTNGFGAPGGTIVTTTGAGGNSSTVGGNPNSLITTIPQSNAIPGVYTYTFVSVTDALGCVYLPNTTATVTILAFNHPAPDLTPNVVTQGSVNIPATTTKEGYIQVSNVRANPTTGIVELEVYLPTNFNLTINPTTVLANGQTVQNGDFDIVYYPGLGYSIKTKPGIIIGANTNLKIGYTLTATGTNLTTGQYIVNIANQTGGVGITVGDDNNINNTTLKTFKVVN
jgi:HYR domain